MPRVSDPRKRAQWRARLQRFAQTSLTVQEFCDREGVSTASLYQWRRKLEGTEAEEASRTPMFLPVELTGGSSELQIQFPNGAVVSVPSHDRELLQACIESAARVATRAGGA